MGYQTKLELAHKELHEKGVWKSHYNPPIAKAMAKIGMCIPPPYYQTFFDNFLISMTLFASVWGALNWIMFWSVEGKPVLEAIYMSLLAGVLFGLIMASFYRYRRKQLQLSDWRSLGREKGTQSD
ncbi:DUF6404 family protein [Vibrio fluminensis]|uniref:DUF6404 family protein n=1 Tax=Vibrio fluminensis TaxID=2783614 RepID=UPI001888F31F|nr:DUF6404 family protein [Vibrio fluminensis]